LDIRILNREFISAIVTSSLVFMAAALTPLVGPLIGLFLPLPIFFYAFRLGRIQGAAVFILSLAVVSAAVFFSALDVNIAVLFLAGSFGLILSEIFRKGLSIERTVFYSVLSILILGSFFLVYHLLTTGQDPMRLVESYISVGIQESIGVYAQLGISPEQLSEIRKSAPLIVKTILNLFPALVIVSAVSFVLINILAGRAIFQRLGMPAPDFGDLSFWKIPDQMVWFVILAGGLILIPRGDVRIIGLNLLIIFLFFYLFQGFAIISYFFRKKNVPLFFRGIIYFLIFAQNFFFLIVMVLGFADIWIDFRKRNTPAADSVEQQ
jgi:uncharacterized protein YybS (DUF2232 family)